MSGTEFINTRELKNKSTELPRKVEAGKTYVITRRGKPVATLKSYSPQDVFKQYPGHVYRELKEALAKKYPTLRKMGREELVAEFEALSQKIRGFSSWEEMDRFLKGDTYGLSR